MALNDNNDIEIFVIMPANRINWDMGLFTITVILTSNSIINRIIDVTPMGNEINGITDCILERFISLFWLECGLHHSHPLLSTF
jgi:hypothetical protein